MPDDDGPKYLNTPETPVYHKSQVLYGVDLARKQIARSQQVVIVEGYTDVMACHLAGVDTAVATCGTAFGEDHVKILRRLLLDQDEHRGEVIFTFDSDEAGRKAALRAFDVDQKFVGQTFVAVTGEGWTPATCGSQPGDEAVRDLVSSRIPLAEFVIRSKIDGFDLDSAEGRTNAVRAAAPVIASIPDRILRTEYVRLLAGWTGVEQAHGRRRGPQASGPRKRQSTAAGAAHWWAPVPDERDPAGWSKREALKLALQSPDLVHTMVRQCAAGRRSPGRSTARSTRPWSAAGGPPAEPDEQWITPCSSSARTTRPLRGAGAGRREPPPVVRRRPCDSGSAGSPRTCSPGCWNSTPAGGCGRSKARLQRINPVESEDEYRRLFADVLALEQYRPGAARGPGGRHDDRPPGARGGPGAGSRRQAPGVGDRCRRLGRGHRRATGPPGRGEPLTWDEVIRAAWDDPVLEAATGRTGRAGDAG